MDKNIIKNHLIKRFVSEEATPGISVTDKAKKESDKINKAGVAAVAKDIKAYEKPLKKEDPDSGKMAKNKYNYTDDAEKTYHDEMEILNGQEMIEYTSEPGAEFKQKAEEAIVGSSRMGNKIGGNAEAVWGASSDDFGKDLVKRVKDSSKKRADAEIQTYGMGDVQIPTGNKVQVATTAIGAGKPKGDTTKATQSSSEKTKIKVVKEENNNNKTQIKESMKRITFKKEFEGSNTTQKIGHALTLIPEAYRTDKKEFEITDGNVTCKIRWEGNLSEGKAIVLTSANKALISEDMSRMKALMGYKSQDTLGLVKGKSRVDENAAFGDIWKKTRKLLGESEDIEDADAVEGSAESLDDAVNQAPEAKKHVEGSVSTDDGTQAPAPKKGEWEKINVAHAADAKKHVEGSVAEVKKTEAPAPKVGEWDKIKVSQSADAKKHVQSGTATHKATDTAKVVKEGIDDEDGIPDESAAKEAEKAAAKAALAKAEKQDQEFYSGDADDTTPTDAEPAPTDVADEVPAAEPIKVGPSSTPIKKMKNPTTGELFLTINGKHAIKDENNNGVPVPQRLFDTYGKDYGEILAAMERGEGEDEELDEYGDEHQVSTKDAVAGMKPGAVKEYGDEHPVSTQDALAGLRNKK